MDIRQIRHFVAVAEELHFGRAAERLGMTQPPLSQSIQALEAELGLPLFERTRRSVTLTAVGLEWLPHARKVLEDAVELPQVARRLSRGEVGRVRLSFISFVSFSFLPRLVRRFKERFPEVELALNEATSDVQIAELLDGALDAGIIIAPPRGALHSPLRYRPVETDKLVVAVPEEWVISGRVSPRGGRLDFDAVRDLPVILFPRQSAPVLHDLVTRYYAERDAMPVAGQQAVQMQTIINLVSTGLGIAFVPSTMRRLIRPGVAYFRVAERQPEIEIGFAWRSAGASAALKHLADSVDEMFPDLPARG
ncbi:LysR family transcriptional regulator [Nitratireductor kimnyeongensis]|uniref:LysR family transcriptional regulator n=1 Tax=Nitratireductor kimnyeongensis TaxID=430679 RepID=A0ABW0TA07_9HYPH|nr:LysR family transcriptional regulator [Nitratireductor kimnyeongensis]QZZ36553.1 LysR family transcriptional regulator [Nitratireductor kimnyeongensis]